MTTQVLAATESSALRIATSITRRLPAAARLALGFIFFASGLAGLLNLLPPPSEPMPEGAMAFGGALLKTGYMFPLIKGTEAAAGALLLTNRFVPLALAVLAPVVVNIFAFHALLAPGVGGASFILALELYLAWAYRHAFAPMLAFRTPLEARVR